MTMKESRKDCREIQRRRRGGFSGLVVLACLSGCGGGAGAPPVLKVYEVKGDSLAGGVEAIVEGEGFRSCGWSRRTSSRAPRSRRTVASHSPRAIPVRGLQKGSTRYASSRTDRRRCSAGGRQDSKLLPYPSKYLDEDSSGLIVTVKAEPNQLRPFVLK